MNDVHSWDGGTWIINIASSNGNYWSEYVCLKDYYSIKAIVILRVRVSSTDMTDVHSWIWSWKAVYANHFFSYKVSSVIWIRSSSQQLYTTIRSWKFVHCPLATTPKPRLYSNRRFLKAIMKSDYLRTSIQEESPRMSGYVFTETRSLPILPIHEPFMEQRSVVCILPLWQYRRRCKIRG